MRASKDWSTGMRRRDFLALATAGLLARTLRAAEAPAAAPTRKPNVLVIISDDQGYADVGVHGCKDIPTPNLDSLAKNGVRFTSGYVSCPVCSPTRAGVITGRYQQRFGHEFNPGPAPAAGAGVGLPLDQATLPSLMKAAGYATGMVGKWHLGYEPQFHPLKRGFDEFFGFLGGAHPYLQAGGTILRGTSPVDEKDYLTDAFAREAVAFIARHKDHPFFLYLTFNAVHNPLQSTQKYLSRFPNIPDKKRQTYAAMLSAMDDGVGAVLNALRDAGLEDDTLIIFHSDNGGPPAANASRNDPLRGSKGTTWEGGIRVPFFIQWKRQLPGGKTFDHPIISLDTLPTAVAAAGGQLPADKPLDGVNLLPYLKGEKQGPPHEALFWRFGPQAAVRKGTWKLVKTAGDWELYDLAADIGEKTNLAAQKPEVVKDLTAAFDAWNAQLVEPLWGRRGGAGPRPRRLLRPGKGKA